MAKGEYIACLDADDMYLASALADLVGFLESNQDVDVVFSDGFFCDVTGKTLMRLSEFRPGPYTGDILEPLVLDPGVVASPCSVLFRRLSAEVIGLRFDTRLKYGVDWDFWIQMARFYRYGYLFKLTCMYRVHGANMTTAVTWRKRKQDLSVGRLKIINSHWFEHLSLSTRWAFFYNLLVDLLGDEPEQQESVLKLSAFHGMPAEIQAALLRQIASSHLSKGQEYEFARDCLRRSLELQPDNLKSRTLLRLVDINPDLARAALSAWELAHESYNRIRSVGERKPKPVPAALSPITEKS